MKIIVDRNIRGAEPTFGRHAELAVMDGRQIRNADLRDADALIVRTATRVDGELLKETPVRFVGSTSIGTDHMDTAWLERHGIAWANAPGCNAHGAAQYTLAMIWLACERLGRDLRDLSAGIVGCGNVGKRVRNLLRAFGVRVVANDPPLADAGERGLVSLDEALAQDIVCLHVPLTRGGPYPTIHLMDQARLAQMQDGALLVNSARGNVVVGDALFAELASRRLCAALDVWPGEPRIGRRLLAATTVATPHVAGYSLEGKLNGTVAVYHAFCAWARLEPAPPPTLGESPEVRVETSQNAISHLLDTCCFVRRHDAAMRALCALDVDQRAAAFDRLRKDYPSRRDFQGWKVFTADPDLARLLRELGFRVAAPGVSEAH